MPRSKKSRQKAGNTPRKAAKPSGAALIARAIGQGARLVSGELRSIFEVIERIEGLLVDHFFENGRRRE